MYRSNQKIQIYVPSANYGRYLSKALESVVRQTFKEWHCYIIDESSNDNTSEIAMLYVKKFGADKFTLIVNKEKLGLQKVSNWVYRNTNAPYVIRLDADDYWMPQLLEKLYGSLVNNQNAALAFGSYTYVSDDNQLITEEKSVNHLRRYDSGLDAPHGACTLVDRHKFLSEGLYFENVDAQDGWDLWLKCFPKYEFISIDEPLFYYRQHDVSLSKNNKRILTARRNLIKLNLHGNFQNQITALIPVAKYLDLSSEKVVEHTKYLINALNSSTYNIRPIITLDTYEQFKRFKELKIHTDVKYTNNSFVYGMNPFKLLEQVEIKNNLKMWLNFNTAKIDTTTIDAALDTFFKFDLCVCVSVQEQREPVFQLTANGLDCISNGRYSDFKLKADELWRMNNILAIANLEDGEKFKSEKTGFFEMSADESKLIHDW